VIRSTCRQGTTLIAATSLGMTLLIAAPASAGDRPGPRSYASWSALAPALVPSGAANVYLTGISCVSPYDCVVVGNLDAESIPIAEQLVGSEWETTPQPVRPRGATVAWLTDVSCAHKSFCMAVGASNADAFAAPLAELFNGSTWTIVPVPDPGGADTQLTSVSCTATTFCVAVGGGSNPAQLFAEAFNGSSWTLSRPVVPRGSEESWLSRVSCQSSICVAVGSVAIGQDQDGDDFRSLIEDYSPSRWTVTPTRDPRGALYSSLAGVSCPKASECVAVGLASTATKDIFLTYSLSGSTWSRRYQAWNDNAAVGTCALPIQ
jgi:hypothetical protein